MSNSMNPDQEESTMGGFLSYYELDAAEILGFVGGVVLALALVVVVAWV